MLEEAQDNHHRSKALHQQGHLRGLIKVDSSNNARNLDILIMIEKIITHPGGAHKDEFLACAVLLAEHDVPVFRQDPTEEDLLNPQLQSLILGTAISLICIILIIINLPGIQSQPARFPWCWITMEFTRMP